MTDNPDSEGWYRDRPARSLTEWREWQKIWSTKYDLHPPIRPKAKKRKKSKFVPFYYNERGWCRTTALPRHYDHETTDLNTRNSGESVTQEECERATLTIDKDTKISKQRRAKKKSRNCIQIFVKTPLSSVVSFDLKPEMTVKEFKELLGCRLGLTVDALILYTGGLKMMDLLSLHDHGISNDSNIEVKIVSGLLGGADKPREASAKTTQTRKVLDNQQTHVEEVPSDQVTKSTSGEVHRKTPSDIDNIEQPQAMMMFMNDDGHECSKQNNPNTNQSHSISDEDPIQVEATEVIQAHTVTSQSPHQQGGEPTFYHNLDTPLIDTEKNVLDVDENWIGSEIYQRYFDPTLVAAFLQSIGGQQEKSALLESEQRLRENCDRMRLMFHGKTPADGNCFFSAVSDQLSLLGLAQNSASQLRKSVVAFLRANPTLQGPDGIIDLSGTQQDWNVYCNTMSKDGEWADAIVVVATAQMLQRDIFIVTSSPRSTGDNAFHWIVGDCNNRGGKTPIKLGHQWELHYRSLIDKDMDVTNNQQQSFTRVIERTAKLKEDGNKLFKQGNIDMAVEKYIRAEDLLKELYQYGNEDTTDKNDLLLKIYLNLSQCFLKLQEPAKAVEYSEKALQLDQFNIKALLRHGLACSHVNELDVAEQSLQQALDNCPQKDKREIREEIEKIRKVKDDVHRKQISTSIREAEDLKESGNGFLKHGHIETAVEKYESAERILTEIQSTYHTDDNQEIENCLLKICLNLSHCFLKLQDTAKAVHYSEKALQLDPLNAKALLRHGRANFQMNLLDVAEESLERAHETCLLIDRQMIMKELTEVKQKKEVSRKQIATTIQEAEDLKQSGNGLLKQGNIASAVEKYQNAFQILTKLEPSCTTDTQDKEGVLLKICLNLSHCFLKLQDTAKAVHYSEKALQLDPLNAKALLRHGRANFQMNQLDIAEQSLEKSLERCPLVDKEMITQELKEVKKKKAFRQKANHVSIDVEYIKKKKDKSIPGAEEAICGIVACLNSGAGGKVTLVNKTKKKGTECEDLDMEFHNFFTDKVGQTDNYSIEGSYRDEKRIVQISPVDQELLLYKSHAFKRSETSSFEVARTRELISILDNNKQQLPVIPTSFVYNKEIMTEGKTIEFKEVNAKNLIKYFDSRYGCKYVSSFANTSGGRLLFGINDGGVVKGIEGISSTRDFGKEIAQKINAMYWFQLDKGQIHPVEGQDWSLKFEEVVGAPEGKVLHVIVLTVRRLERGIVFCKQPLCPVLDPKEKHGYRMMKFNEWCQYLQKFPECTGDFVDRIANELRIHYRNTICQKQLYPWEPGCFVKLDDIYVHLTIDIELAKPCRPIKQRLTSYDEIFGSEETNMRYILEGRPGLGKTTLCAKMAHDWSEANDDKSPLRHIRLLFILQLGVTHYNTNIEDAIKEQLLPSLELGGTQKLRKAIQELGSSVIIVLDSLDEADPMLFEHREPGNLVRSMKYLDLKSNRVLVTSRPERVCEITEIQPYRRLELQGFIRADVVKYVNNFFNQTPTDITSLALGRRLVQYIQANKLVVDASVPLLALQICWYWLKTNGKEDIPQRWTHLYDKIFDIMYESLPSDLKHLVSKKQIVEHLGQMAYQGLTPNTTKLVFSEDVIKWPENVKTSAFKMGLISKKGHQEKSITFFHKSAQEKIAGEYLANHPSELRSYLQSVNTVQNAQQIGLVLIAASACSRKAAECVMEKLVGLFRSEFQSKIESYFPQGLHFDEFRRIQQYIELCLECNYEANCKTKFNCLLDNLFFKGRVSFCGIQPYPSVAFGYYLTQCESKIGALKLHPAPHISEKTLLTNMMTSMYEENRDNMLCLPDDQLRTVCESFKEQYRDVLSSDTFLDLSDSPRETLPYIQCIQSCEGMPSSTETNIEPIVKGFQYVKLWYLDMKHFQLGNNFALILNSIENGHMTFLQNLVLAAIGVSGQHITQLVSLIPKMPSLVFLDIGQNEFEPGKTFRIFAENLKRIKLNGLNINLMYAPADDMEVLSQNLQFASHLTALMIDWNYMNDNVADNLANYWPAGLNRLSISVQGLSSSKHRKLLMSLCKLKVLQILYVRGTDFSLDLIDSAACVLSSCPVMLLLDLMGNPKSPDITHGIWNRMKDALTRHKQLLELSFRDIALGKDDFEELIRIGKERKYESLSYSSGCVPVGASDPQEDFFHLID